MREWPRRFRNDEIAGATLYELDKEIYLSIYLSIYSSIYEYISLHVSIGFVLSPPSKPVFDFSSNSSSSLLSLASAVVGTWKGTLRVRLS